MGRAAGIITKLNKVLDKVGPPVRTIYKRVVTRTGGDDLIGRPSTVTNTDTAFDPQPYFSRLGKEAALYSGSKILMADDMRGIISPDSLTLTELKSPNLFLVFKESGGAEEQFLIVDYKGIELEGVQVGWQLVIRSVKRT